MPSMNKHAGVYNCVLLVLLRSKCIKYSGMVICVYECCSDCSGIAILNQQLERAIIYSVNSDICCDFPLQIW